MNFGKNVTNQQANQKSIKKTSDSVSQLIKLNRYCSLREISKLIFPVPIRCGREKQKING